MRLHFFILLLLTGFLIHAQQINPNPWVMAIDSTAPITYRNPVIPGFYSDPSICRVGEDYYLITSTFEFFPGIPVFHSKDLINWNQIGHVIHRREQFPNGLNIFAATLRYHQGTYYMITTTVMGEGNFYMTATNPAGPWSDPIFIDVEAIDPDLFFDEDGKVYVISSTFDLAQIDLSTGQLVTEKRKVWHGTGGRYPEGPHIYKKDGYYYLMASEGGTEEAHQVTISRSNNIWGPYISNPANPILFHANIAGMDKAIHGVGHADLVQAHDGSWWITFHGYRSVTGYPVHHTIGRETCMAPVSWPIGGWPEVNGNGTISVDMRVPTLPQVPIAPKPTTINFEEPLGLEWNYIQIPEQKNYELNTKKGTLSLIGSDLTIRPIGEKRSPTFVGRRLTDLGFESITRLSFDPKNKNEEAGMILYNNGSHFDIIVTTDGDRRYLQVKLMFGQNTYRSNEIHLKPGYVDLKISGTGQEFTFAYAQEGQEFQVVDRADARFMSSETLGWFTGVYVGLYATGNGQQSKAKATYEWFEYRSMD